MAQIGLSELAKIVNGCVYGDGTLLLTGVGSLEKAKPGQLSFYDNAKFRRFLTTTQAAALLVDNNHLSALDALKVPKVVVDDVKFAFTQALRYFYPDHCPNPSLHPTAVIASTATVPKTCVIGPNVVIEEGVVFADHVVIGANCVIGEGTTIGESTRLYPNVTVYHHTVIGKRVKVHSGAIIGADGFGLAFHQDHWENTPQVGRVVVGDDVDIGASTCIDRGALDDTIIGNGVKLDNQIQIAHNVVIGDHTLIAGCTGVAGSVKIGSYCLIAGGVNVADHVAIADQVRIAGASSVSKTIHKPGAYGSGMRILPYQQWRDNLKHFHRLDKLVNQVKQLNKQVSNEDE